MKLFTLASAATALSLLSTAGFAGVDTVASATTDLNIRSGPGPQYDVIGVIPRAEEATIEGCIKASNWCKVSHGGTEGWAYSDYLTAMFGDADKVVVVTERPAEAVPVVTYEPTVVSTTTTTTTTKPKDDPAGGALAGAATGAVAGALIGGPVGAAVGGAAGAVSGGTLDAVVTPPEKVTTYVTTNRVDPVYLNGEVVVGAGLPDTVQIRKIPDYQYEYAYVNRQPVLVEPQTRRIVYVYR